LRSLWFGGGRNRDDKAGAIFMIIGIALAIIAPIVVMLVQASISRKREYSADATSVKFTRNPQGLIGALEKIKQDSSMNPKKVSKAVAPLFFSNPFKNAGASHPPLGERIKVLKSMWKIQKTKYRKIYHNLRIWKKLLITRGLLEQDVQ